MLAVMRVTGHCVDGQPLRTRPQLAGTPVSLLALRGIEVLGSRAMHVTRRRLLCCASLVALVSMLAALTRSPRKDIIYVESSEQRSDPCEAMSPHGYLGIEADVVQRISEWIRAAGGR